MSITAVCQLVITILVQIVFQDINLQSKTGLIIWIGSMVLAGTIFGFTLRSYMRRRKIQS